MRGRWSSKRLVFSVCIETKRGRLCRITAGFDTFWRKNRAPELLNHEDLNLVQVNRSRKPSGKKNGETGHKFKR